MPEEDEDEGTPFGQDDNIAIYLVACKAANVWHDASDNIWSFAAAISVIKILLKI